MKIHPDFEIRDICGEHVLSSRTSTFVDLGNLVVFNETATYLWNAVQGRDFTADDMTQLLLAGYDVEPAQAAADVSKILGEWQELGLILPTT